MGIAKKQWMYGLIVCTMVLGFAWRCNATTYLVGDTSGWDISSDLDSWSQPKRFLVGDVLVFQYSSSESINEVTKENFDTCNTANVLKAYSTGNTTVTLSNPGDRYFVSGNRLYCLGGMKLHVHVESNQAANSPAAAPQPQPPSGASDLPRPSSKKDNNVPSAAGGLPIGGRETLVLLLLGYVSNVLIGVCGI